MYYPPLFGRADSSHPLDLSLKTPAPADPSPEELMLDHRKLASLAASHSLAMGHHRMLDPYRLYDPPPPFVMASLLQQQQQREQLYGRFVDPSLRNGLTQREAAAALAATRGGLYALPPAPVMLPAFSLYEDKGASFRWQQQHACSGVCCVPSQAALCARSPMGGLAKDPAPAATPTFLHRPTATTTAASSNSELRLSVSSLCTTRSASPDPITTVSSASSSRNPAPFRAGIWNAGLPSVTTSSKTAFSVPKKNGHSHHHSNSSNGNKDRPSGSIKDILKDTHPPEAPKSRKYPEDFPLRFNHRDETPPFNFHKSSVIKSVDTHTTATSLAPIVASRCGEGIPQATKMPPLLEAEPPADPPTHSPQGPPPLIAVSGDHSHSVIKSPYEASRIPSYNKPEKPAPNPPSSSKPKPKYSSPDHAPLAFPKPIPAKPIPQMAHPFSSHYRAGQHQMSLQSHNEWIPHANPNVTVPLPTSSVATPTGGDVLQSLLARSADATSTVPSGTHLPLFSLDYRFPIASQMNLLPLAMPPVPPFGKDSSKAADVPKTTSDSANATSVVSSKHKKRSAAEDGQTSTASVKKRILSADYNSTPIPRYLFQPAAFVNEVASEAPECPYTFIPEPPLNYASRVKGDENQKPLWRDAMVKSEDLTASRDALKSPVLVPAKSPSKPTERAWSPGDVRARRRLRRRLLRRICAQRRPLRPSAAASAQEAAAAADRRLAVRHARKLLSQLTLRWAHRRYLHKWHAIKRRLLLRKKAGRKAKAPATNKSKDSACDLVMPPEMKRLMVNKALGETQLHRAARLGYPQAVAYCLKSKCVSVNARDNAGYTPLHECCTRGHLDIARALLQYGADVNASAAGGIRPLHDAVENDHVEIVRLLLSYGADPTIATYSGAEPMKLARSAMMAEFLQGFFADISGEVDSRPHLPWRFWGSAKCLDPEECGADVFGGVPGGDEGGEREGECDNDFLFEVSDSPHLPTFRLLLPPPAAGAQCNYLRLSDVLRKLNLTKEEFVRAHPHIEVLALPRYEFEASATCSPLLSGSNKGGGEGRPAGETTDLVRLDNGIRKVLGIETISVR